MATVQAVKVAAGRATAIPTTDSHQFASLGIGTAPVANQSVTISGATSTHLAIASQVDADTVARCALARSGQLQWSSGAAAVDLTAQRTAVGVFTIGDGSNTFGSGILTVGTGTDSIGTTAVFYGAKDGSAASINVASYGVSGNTNRPLIACLTARGTHASPAVVQLNDRLANLEPYGYNGTIFSIGGSLFFAAAETWSGTAKGTDVFIATVAKTTTTNRVVFTVTSEASVVCGASGALATTATDGFLYLPTCAGAPTGTPTTQTGKAPCVIDTTNGRFYSYYGGAWHLVALV